MAETIESFVAKLHAEGVEAGRREAEKLVAEAREQADALTRRARAEAEKLLADARRQAEAHAAKSQAELQLAARDTLLRLREALNRALRAVLTHQTRAALEDGQFLRVLIHDVVLEYAKADSQGEQEVKLNVQPQMREQLAKWLIQEMVHKTEGLSIDLTSALDDAGFEYEIRGQIIEVTAGSVVEALAEMVGAELRKILEEASASEKK
jgi:V/A-type H+-transporting ATPase subunit E